MKTIAHIRRERLAELLGEFRSYAAINAKIDLDARDSTLNQIATQQPRSAKDARPRSMGARMARKLERGCGKPEGWMDSDPAAAGTWPLPMVDRARWDRLSAEDQAYVQGAFNNAMADREAAQLATPPGTGPGSVHPAPQTVQEHVKRRAL